MLTFNLKKEWFDKIKSGEKTHEYRLYNSYWEKRLCKRMNDYTICFACGYPKKEDTAKRIYAKLTRVYYLKSGIMTDLKIDKPVYDIEFELIKDFDNAAI